MTNEVNYEEDNGLATLTLNRPDKLNGLTVGLFAELERHVEALATNDRIGCVVLRGAGKCFSAGHDLRDIAEGERPPRRHFQAGVIERLAKLPQPVISAVHGHCYTGALELALAGDIVLASENAKFADTHAKWGLTPVWGLSQRLPRRVGATKAMEMMLTCRTIGGAEAAAIGLANACFADDAFEAGVEGFARQVLENSWFSHRTSKRLIADTDGASLGAGLAAELRDSPGIGPDAAERVNAFTSKRS